MPPALKLGLGLFATIIFGVLGIHLGLASPSARGIEASLEAAARARLDARGQGWATVRLTGQRAALIGAAPDEAAARQAVLLTVTTAGPGGPVMGAITGVDRSALTVRAPAP